MKRALVMFAVALSPILAPTFAGADESVPPSTETPKSLGDSLTGSARTDYDVAKVLFRDGDFEGARLKFEGAYEKSKDARLLFDVARCENHRDNFARTIRLVRRYLKEAGAGVTDAEKKEADDLLARLQPLVAPLTLDVSEAGARVYVDDELVGQSPLPEPVLAEFIRPHKIRVAKAGFADLDAEVVINDAAGLTKALTLEKPEGHVVVMAGQGDTISVDGKLVTMGRLEAPLPYGAHHVKVTAPGYVTYEADVVLQDKQPRMLNVKLTKEKGARPALWMWVASGALVVVGAGVGGYFLFRKDSSAQGITSMPGTLGGVHVMTY